MTLPFEALEFLKGKQFSAGYCLKIAPHSPLRDRFAILSEWFKGKSVVHLGCVDHVPLIAEKMANGLWMHGRICDVASRCVGVDANAEGIAVLRETHGIRDVYCCDLTREVPEALSEREWDYLFLGEIIEHVDNPVDFLTALRCRLGGRVKRLVLTAPNALRLDNFLGARRNRECINTDHRYWFTPYTLAKVLIQAGFEPESIELAMGSPLPSQRGIRALVSRSLLKKHPLFRDTIVLPAQFPK